MLNQQVKFYQNKACNGLHNRVICAYWLSSVGPGGKYLAAFGSYVTTTNQIFSRTTLPPSQLVHKRSTDDWYDIKRFSCVHSFFRSFVNAFVPSFIHLFICSFVLSFVRFFLSFVRSFVRLFGHSFIRLFMRSFISSTFIAQSTCNVASVCFHRLYSSNIRTFGARGSLCLLHNQTKVQWLS